MRGVLICDLDGTLCNVQDRRKHLETKDWKAFYAGIPHDLPDTFVSIIVRAAETTGMPVYFVSGRPEEYREITERWLSLYEFKHEALFMRPTGDSRPDTQVKKDIYRTHIDGMEVALVIDDRPSVIRMWRELGLPVLDVGDGIDF